MYDIVIDVDGVLLDIHKQMEIMMNKLGIEFNIDDVYTYDFNKNLPNLPEFTKLPPRELIFGLFNKPELYRDAHVDWDSIILIRDLARQGYNFLIYTISNNIDVFMVKQTLFAQWFAFMPNIAFESITYPEKTFKKGILTKSVIEDCHINLREYSHDTAKFLINKHYNQMNYNTEYMDVFTDSNFHRCCTTESAIIEASTYVASITPKLQ